MKFSSGLIITLLAAFWFVPQTRAASSTLSKVVVALKPDKDPDAMIAEREQLSKYLSGELGRSVEVIVPLSATVILEGLSNGTIGYLGKFFSDAFESVDLEVARGLRAIGAGRIQAFQHGLWPNARPLVWSYSLWMLEYNIRSASIVGYVGAGGVGVLLHIYQEYYQWDRFAAVLIFILGLVTVLTSLENGSGGRSRRAFRATRWERDRNFLQRFKLKRTGTSTCVATGLPARRARPKDPAPAGGPSAAVKKRIALVRMPAPVRERRLTFPPKGRSPQECQEAFSSTILRRDHSTRNSFRSLFPRSVT